MLEKQSDKMLRKDKDVKTKKSKMINFMYPVGEKPIIIKATSKKEADKQFINLTNKK